MQQPISIPIRNQTQGTPRAIIEHVLSQTASPPVRSLYIHVPFCFHKCHYCDFYSIVDPRDRQEPFTDRLIRELEALAPLTRSHPLHTIFIGGGTPTLLRPELWLRLLTTLNSHFDLTDIRAGRGEFTVECNPETATPELCDILRAGGVDRLSLGAQSFNPIHLKTLERWHDPANVARAIKLAKAAGIPRQSVDLIFAIPGQTLDDWKSDLHAALALGVDHLSCYSLTYEPNTAMTARLKRGEFALADEDLEVEMHHETLRTLRAAGFDRYEVSNYARPDQESRHNLAYWRQHQWLAAGPSASAHVAGHRWKNSPRLDDYLAIDDAGCTNIQDLETPDPRRALAETIMTGLRLREGLDRNIILANAERVTPTSSKRLDRVISRLTHQGWLQPDEGRLALTDEGFLFADSAAADLMRCLNP
ncbi:MAG: radical SAM family heme chaperone HemW [Phycisphaerales bacterium]